MGYDSHAFVFYGFEIEHLEYPQCDELQSTYPFCIVETGCWATGKPSKRHFVMLRDTYQPVHDSMEHGQLYEFDGALAIQGSIQTEQYEQAKEYVKENDLVIVGDPYGIPFFKWYVGTWGS
jgi:hypothetical protein